MIEQRIKYRTPDNIWHLWTQAEIDTYIEQSLTTPPRVEQMGHVKLPLFEDEPMSIQEEAALTVKMLYDVLYQPYAKLDHETVQELLSRIDVMCEPLKEMVQALEVEAVPPGIHRLAQEARSAESEEGGFDNV